MTRFALFGDSTTRFRMGLAALSLITALSTHIDNTFAASVDDLDWIQSVQTLLKPYDASAMVSPSGWVTVGEASYMVAKPEEPSSVEPLAFSNLTSGEPLPEVIELNDGHLLVKVTTLPNGRPSLPLLATLPFTYKSKSFIQTTQLPENLLVPAPWKTLMGNLLAQTGKQAKTFNTLSPLVLTNPDTHQILLWSPNDQTVQSTIPLPCEPASVVVGQNGQDLWVGCADQARLLQVSVNTGLVTNSLALAAPVHKLRLDETRQWLWVHHALSFLPPEEPVEDMALKTDGIPIVPSGVVGTLLGASKSNPAPTQPQASTEKMNTSIFKFYNHAPVLKGYADLPVLKQLVMASYRRQAFGLSPDGKLLHLFSLYDGQPIKSIKLPVSMDFLQLNDQKILWMASRSARQVFGFDVRWQEFTPPMTLKSDPMGLSHSASGPVVLTQDGQVWQIDPVQRQFKPLMTGVSLPTSAFTVLPSLTNHALFIVPDPHPTALTKVSIAQSKVQTWDLPQAETIDVQGWLDGLPSQQQSQATIRFQDGRLLLQTAPTLPEAP